MVENFFYEIEHYGGVLNANRTYYLGRSQPPFLTSMILAVYQSDQAAGKANLTWLRRAYQYAVTDYSQWTHAPHLAGDTGLSRYYDEGEGPVPEIMGDPSDYYHGVAEYFLMHEGESSPHLVRVDEKHPPSSILGPIFPVRGCYSDKDEATIANREIALHSRLTITKATAACANPASTFPFALDLTAPKHTTTLLCA